MGADLLRWTSAISELSIAVNEQQDLGSLLRRIARTACDLLEYESSAVLLENPDATTLRIEGSWGLSASYIAEVNHHRPLGLTPDGPFADSPSRRAYFEGEPALIDDIDTDPSYGPWAEAARAAGHRSMASVPLRSRQRVVGTFNIYGTRPRQLAPEGTQLLQVLANHAGIAFETHEMLARDRSYLVELRQLNGDLHEQQALLLAHAEIHERLMSVVQRGGGLNETAAELAALGRCAVGVTDRSGNLLCSAPYGGIVVDPPESLTADAEISLNRASGAAVVRAESGARALLAAPVRVGGETLGMVWVSEPGGDPELHLRALEQAAVVIGQALLLRRAREDAEWQLRGDLLAEILTNKGTDRAALTERGKRIGNDLSLPHVIAVLHAPDADPDAQRLLRTVQSHAAGLPSPRILLTKRDATLVIAVPAHKDHPPESIVRRIRQVAAASVGHPIRVSMSTPVAVDQFPSALQQATSLLRLVPETNDEAVLTAESSGLVGFILAALDPIAISALAERWIGPLRSNDDRKGTDLVDTLRAYTDLHQSTAATAKALFVHPNTVNLRLRRIESLLGASLSNLDHLTAMRAALLIDDLRRHDGLR